MNFDIEVLGFSEEEGVRFRVPFLGSLAAAGCLNSKLLQLKDANGCTVADAIRQFGLDPFEIQSACIDERAFAYLEFHIEQGPVLDSAGASLAAVDVIVGQSRWELSFRGAANHAGTTPMELRRDALAGAAEWISSVEHYARSVDGLVATVGKLEVLPGAGNVIPGEVRASLDVRHRSDEIRMAAVGKLCGEAKQIGARRSLDISFAERMNQRAVAMDERLVRQVEKALQAIGETPRRMLSGAGHDAMIMAQTVPSAMVFLRSLGGISHHPDETVRLEDVEKAIRLGVAILTDLAA
jgi:allantoate deiminase